MESERTLLLRWLTLVFLQQEKTRAQYPDIPALAHLLGHSNVFDFNEECSQDVDALEAISGLSFTEYLQNCFVYRDGTSPANPIELSDTSEGSSLSERKETPDDPVDYCVCVTSPPKEVPAERASSDHATQISNVATEGTDGAEETSSSSGGVPSGSPYRVDGVRICNDRGYMSSSSGGSSKNSAEKSFTTREGSCSNGYDPNY